MEPNQISKSAELEALLFLHGEPMPFGKISAVLQLDESATDAVIKELQAKLNDDASGLHLLIDKEKVQMATKPAFGGLLEAFVKEELTEELTPASVETLAIIAYLGPISRPKIEYLRGVNSSMILRTLTLRGLVERFPDPEHPSGFIYRTTFDFMKHLGLQSTEELPDFEKFQKLLEVFNNEKAEQPQ